MTRIDLVIQRIKELLAMNKKSFDFTNVDGSCTDCSRYPIVNDINGYEVSVSKIKLSDDFNDVILYGTNECQDEIDFDIYCLSLDEMILVLNTMERIMGLPEFMLYRKTNFPITSLSREDITALGYKNVESISDEVMEKIARKMGDSYLENSYWIDLEYMVDTYCGLEKGEVKNN